MLLRIRVQLRSWLVPAEVVRGFKVNLQQVVIAFAFKLVTKKAEGVAKGWQSGAGKFLVTVLISSFMHLLVTYRCYKNSHLFSFIKSNKTTFWLNMTFSVYSYSLVLKFNSWRKDVKYLRQMVKWLHFGVRHFSKVWKQRWTSKYLRTLNTES